MLIIKNFNLISVQSWTYLDITRVFNANHFKPMALRYYLKFSTASYSETSRGENFTTKLPFFPAGMLPLSGSITKGKTSLPSLTTLPASYARARALDGLPPREDPGRWVITGARVWGCTEDSPAEVEGRPVCWLDCPAELANLSGRTSSGSPKLTVFGFSRD